jgi:V8-like Glu-specific endopeptidase
VTQSGYPVDHLDTLYTHTDCIVTGWAQTSVLSHQCDTLPGDSGSPLMLKTDNGWQLIGVQSSAPAAKTAGAPITAPCPLPVFATSWKRWRSSRSLRPV